MSNLKICVSDTMPSSIRNRKPKSVWVRPQSGKIYSVNEYGCLYVSSLGSSLVNTEGVNAWFQETLNGLKEALDSQGIPASSMAALFQKCKEDAASMLTWNTANPDVYKVPKGTNVLQFVVDFLKTTALYYDPKLTGIATPLKANRDLFGVSQFELERPDLFAYGGVFFGKYRARLALIFLTLADSIQTDLDSRNYTDVVITGNTQAERSASAAYAGNIFDIIASTIS
jgi:hypothetical protein